MPAWVAGTVGFEPTVAESKSAALTAWLRPSITVGACSAINTGVGCLEEGHRLKAEGDSATRGCPSCKPLRLVLGLISVVTSCEAPTYREVRARDPVLLPRIRIHAPGVGTPSYRRCDTLAFGAKRMFAYYPSPNKRRLSYRFAFINFKTSIFPCFALTKLTIRAAASGSTPLM